MTVRRVRSILCSLTTALVAATVFTACPDGVPLPLAGWAEFQDLLFVEVPRGSVNAGGGNFHTRRTDLSIDTRVGSHALGAVYNSASGGWRWSHEMTYQGTTFVDDTGASFNLSSVASGTAIPGTHWCASMRTRSRPRAGSSTTSPRAGSSQRSTGSASTTRSSASRRRWWAAGPSA
jgi:hypothetical protein